MVERAGAASACSRFEGAPGASASISRARGLTPGGLCRGRNELREGGEAGHDLHTSNPDISHRDRKENKPREGHKRALHIKK
jgi:hypothetical protein